MKTLKGIVHTQTMLLGALPVLLVSFVAIALVVRHGFLDSLREAQANSARDLRNLDQSSSLLEDRWHTMLAATEGPDHRFADTLLRRWVNADSGICLMSVWKKDSLVFSYPRRDESRILLWTDRIWTGVENSPRCDEPVVRHIAHLGEDHAAVISVRLSYLSRKLLAALPDSGKQFSLVDYQGVYVGSFQTASVAQQEIEPLIPRVKPGSKTMSGWTLEKGRVVAYSARNLEGPPWILIARQDALETMRPLLPLLALMLVVLFATMLLGIRLAKRSSGKILDPLEQLRKSLDSLEAGHFESHLPAAELQEIDDLSSAYNRMSGAIQAREKIRRQELERMISELEAFSFSVSHDLRAPLRAIEGYTRILDEDEGHRLSSEGRAHLGKIHTGATRMGLLIEDLLRLSRTSRAHLVTRNVDMDELVREVVDGLGSEIGERLVDWRIGRLGTAVGDHGLLRQVWENLISNALKYSSRRDRSIVEIGRGAEPGSDSWWIRDNGAGFDPDLRERLFGTFQRLHTNQEFEGTGIGLALVRRIVEKHGGTIEARGEIDKGATFTFRIPSQRDGST